MKMSLEKRVDFLEADNRRLFALGTAHEFAIEILLTQFLRGLSEEDRDGFAEEFIRVGSKIWQNAKDDEQAEVLADIAVQSQERLANLMQKALGRVNGGR